MRVLIQSLVRKTVWIPVFIGMMIGAGGCQFLNEGNIPDIDGWWEITFYVQSSTCPSAVTGFSAPTQIKVKVEFSYDKVQAVLTGYLYENNSFIADVKGDMDENGNFEIQATVTRGDDDVEITLNGTFRESTVTGQMSQNWSVNSQNITCAIKGSFIGQKL